MKFFGVLLVIFAIFSVTSAIPLDAPAANQTKPVGRFPPCCKNPPNNTVSSPNKPTTQSSISTAIPSAVPASPPQTGTKNVQH